MYRQRIHGVLKAELIHGEEFRNETELRLALSGYINQFYNRSRLHSALGYLNPVEFERMEDSLVKVVLRLEEGGDVYVETPWATDLGGGRYRLENCPFYFYDLAYGDIFSAEYSEEDERLAFVKVLEPSGHKLVRILFENPADEEGIEKEQLDNLVAMGCSYEGANPKYICLDIPPEIKLGKVTEYLIINEINWEHAAPSYGTLYPSG